MKKLTIVFALMLMLVGCGSKEENTTNTNNKNNNAPITEEDAKSDIITHFEGRTENYSAEITVSKFTAEDEKLIESEFGKDSDEYISLQDNRPEYKVESFVLYDGDGNVDLKEVKELKISISNMNSYTFLSEQEIVKVLQGKENITHNYFVYEDNRNELPTEDDIVEMSGTFDGNSALDFTIELEAVK